MKENHVRNRCNACFRPQGDIGVLKWNGNTQCQWGNAKRVHSWLVDLFCLSLQLITQNHDEINCFLSDLKKLIRTDIQNKRLTDENQPNEPNSEEIRGPERLYLCSTYSSRSKAVNQNASTKAPTYRNEVNVRIPPINIIPPQTCKMKENTSKKTNCIPKVQTQEFKKLKSASSGGFKSAASNTTSRGVLKSSNSNSK